MTTNSFAQAIGSQPTLILGPKGHAGSAMELATSKDAIHSYNACLQATCPRDAERRFHLA